MLEELVLMRHAHAMLPVGAQADFDRALSVTGLDEAWRAGEWLAAETDPVDAVMCSPARRTRQTLARVGEAGCRLPEPGFVDDIYDASLGDLLQAIETRLQTGPMPARLLLIGHNPGLEQLLFHLDTAARLQAIPTAGIAVLRFDGRKPPTDPGAARIVAHWAP